MAEGRFENTQQLNPAITGAKMSLLMAGSKVCAGYPIPYLLRE
jgi:hypothetical protein